MWKTKGNQTGITLQILSHTPINSSNILHWKLPLLYYVFNKGYVCDEQQQLDAFKAWIVKVA